MTHDRLLPSLEAYVDNIADEAVAAEWRTEHKRSRPSQLRIGSRLLVREHLGESYTRDVEGTIVKRIGKRLLVEFKSGARSWAEYTTTVDSRGRLDTSYDLARPLWETVCDD